MKNNIYIHKNFISKRQKEKLLNQSSFVLWFTGLSGSGKSTLMNYIDTKLFELKYKTVLLDGDNIRHTVNKDLSFTKEGRKENIRRVSEISKILIDSGLIVLASFISPYKEDRENAKKIIGEDNFIEIFVNTPIKICEKRDPKNLYKKSKNNEIKNFTGISQVYEEPENADINLNTENKNLEELSLEIINYLKKIKKI